MLGHPSPSDYRATRWAIVAALMGALAVVLGDVSVGIQLAALCIGAAGLYLALHNIVIRPWLRTRRLKKPCDVRFVVRGYQDVTLNYVIQDDERHILNELVLPSHSIVEIEFGYKPQVPIQLEVLIFGCEGDIDSKPYVIGAYDKFTGRPADDKLAEGDHRTDINKNWHTIRKVARSVGGHFVVTYRVQTSHAGVYPVNIAFMTNEIEGSGELTIRVEDRPTTRMRCRRHEGCWVRPMPISPSASAARPS